jgi:hypothetical protein
MDVLLPLVSTESDKDPLECFTPETRVESVGVRPPFEDAIPGSLKPQVQASVPTIVETIDDIEKHIDQHLAALDEASRLTEERLRTVETLVAEMRVKVRVLDKSKEAEVVTLNTTANCVDVLPPGLPQRGKMGTRQRLEKLFAYWQPKHLIGPLTAFGVLTVLVLVSVVVTRPNPPTLAQRAALSTAQPVITKREQPTANREPPAANREQPLARRQPRTIEQRPEVFLGTLTVRSDPKGAAVFLNGRAVGMTPVRLPGVHAGSYALRIDHDGYQRWTAAILVPADKQTDIVARLDVQNAR